MRGPGAFVYLILTRLRRSRLQGFNEVLQGTAYVIENWSPKDVFAITYVDGRREDARRRSTLELLWAGLEICAGNGVPLEGIGVRPGVGGGTGAGADVAAGGRRIDAPFQLLVGERSDPLVIGVADAGGEVARIAGDGD